MKFKPAKSSHVFTWSSAETHRGNCRSCFTTPCFHPLSNSGFRIPKVCSGCYRGWGIPWSLHRRGYPYRYRGCAEGTVGSRRFPGLFHYLETMYYIILPRRSASSCHCHANQELNLVKNTSILGHGSRNGSDVLAPDSWVLTADTFYPGIFHQTRCCILSSASWGPP